MSKQTKEARCKALYEQFLSLAIRKNSMPIALHQKLIYLDRAYIADFYEVTTGDSASTTVTKNQSKKAGAAIPIFSAEVSAQEVRSYKVSTLEMLALTWEKLNTEPDIDLTHFSSGKTSQYGWFEGELSVYQAKASTTQSEHFQIRQSPTSGLSLITTPEYFLSGLGTLVKLQETVLNELSIPTRAYVRVIAADTYFKDWVAIPLVMLERDSSG